MPWLYEQASGFLYDPAGVKLFPPGYSGAFGIWQNNPKLQNIPMFGCIPAGWYTRGRVIPDDPETGISSIELIPDAANNMFGRDDMRMHGDSRTSPGHASKGCIIQAHPNRLEFSISEDLRLQVVDVRPLMVMHDPDLAI